MFRSFTDQGEMKIPVKVCITPKAVVLIKDTGHFSVLDRYVDSLEVDLESALLYFRYRYSDLNFDKVRIIDMYKK